MPAIEYYPTIKWNEFLIHTTTWMDLENMPCEIIQTQNNQYLMIPLT